MNRINRNTAEMEVSFLTDNNGITFFVRIKNTRRIETHTLKMVINLLDNELYKTLPEIDKYQELYFVD